MSLDDLAIKKHTDPLRAELDRQKEKAAKFKAQRDALVEALEKLASSTRVALSVIDKRNGWPPAAREAAAHVATEIESELESASAALKAARGGES